MQRAVERAGSGLQEPMGTFLGPLHLLLLGEAPADDEVDVGKGGRDGLAVVPTRRIVCDRPGIVLDIGVNQRRRHLFARRYARRSLVKGRGRICPWLET